MMRLMILIGIITMDVTTTFNQTNIKPNKDYVSPKSKPTSKVCQAKQIEMTPVASKKDMQLIGSESQIAIDGHLSGFRPLAYNIRLKVMNFENFSACVTILVKSVKPTKTLVINFDAKALTVKPNNIRLYMLKVKSKDSNAFHGFPKNKEREICLNKTMKSVEGDSTLIIGLQETVPAHRLFLLKFENYSGRVFAYPKRTSPWDVHKVPPMSHGLRRTDQDLPSAALYTMFQMRMARTVFPSFDHPIFKTNFSVCIEHEKSTTALSNMIVQYRKDMNSSITDCFKTTPKIPIYILTFSILENFTVVTDDEGSTTVEVYYAAEEQASDFDWERGYAKKVLAYIKQKFNVNLGIDRLAFLNLQPSVMWGIENYGLVSLDASKMAEQKDLSRSILVHEIVHQWLGDDATISYWDEICLQEGLTAYLMDYISEALNFTIPMEDSVAAKVTHMLNTYAFIISAPIRKFNVTQDIANHCFGYPFIVFYMMRKAYGEELWTAFLKRLFNEYHFGHANFTQWIQILDEIAPISINQTMSAGQFLHKWFTSDGYPVSYVKINDGEVEVIQRAAYGLQDWYYYHGVRQYMSDASVLRPIPYKVIVENDEHSIEMDIFVDNKNFSFRSNSNAPKWVVLDPAGTTLTRILYEPEVYLGIINSFRSQTNFPIKADRLKQIFNDFCFAFSHNAIFLNEEDKSPANPNVAAWETLVDVIYDLFLEDVIDLTSECSCCFKPRSLLVDDDLDYEGCKYMWNEKCRHNDLMILLQRTYVLLEEDEF